MSKQDTYAITAEELRQLIERIERFEAEKQDAVEGQKEVYAEAKGRGYDTKALRKVIARRKRSRAELAEEETLIEIYEAALEL